MKPVPIAEIWSRVVADVTISTFEEFQLSNAVAADDGGDLRSRLIRDEQMVGLLSSLGHCALSEDEFVAKLTGRLHALPESGFPNHATRPTRRGEETAVHPRDAAANPWNPAHRFIGHVAADVLNGTPSNRQHELPESITTKRPSHRARWLVVTAIVASLLVGIATGFALQHRQPADVDALADGIPPDEAPDVSLRSRAEVSSPSQSLPDRQLGRKRTPDKTPPLRTVARLDFSPTAVWQTPPSERLGAEPLVLLSGSASVTFDNGATVLLRGATEMQLVSPSEVTLRRGRLSIVVPPRAVGFTTNAPAARIIDLGTKFDVDADADGTTNVLVRLGRVRVIPQGSRGEEDERLLTAGERIRLEVNRKRSPRIPLPRDQRQGTVINGPIVRGVQIINGQRFEYNSREELERLREQFPQLRGVRERRTNKPTAPKKPQAAKQPARADAQSTNKPSKTNSSPKKLYGIEWHPDLQGALKEATRTDKPVMVLRVLGNLSGFM